MRKGPHPLSVHISMAAAEMARAEQSADPETLQRYQHDFAAMLSGIQRYQCWETSTKRPPTQTVYEAGTLSVQRLDAYETLYAQPDAPLVLLIPSMINRAHILNLTEDRSMMRYMAEQGMRPFLLSWGESKNDPGQADFDTLLHERVISSLVFLQDTYGQKPHLMGYCMGGTLVCAAGVLRPDLLASVTFLAAPWDFHAGAQALKQRVEFWYPAAQQVMEARNYLDQDWLQTVFASLDPLMTRDKFMKFSQMPAGSADADLFVAIEDWLNEGVDLPRGIAHGCIQQWFFENQPARGLWFVGDVKIDPKNLDVPALVIASHQDRLVEYHSAYPLYQALPRAQVLAPSCGHIGMIAGRRAQEEVWRPMVTFISSCHSGAL